jgi:hypothetical protein
MNPIQEEAARLIAIEIARLTDVADAAACAALIAQRSAVDARLNYQSARTTAAANAMRIASINEYLAVDALIDAGDAVKAGRAARELLITALRGEEAERSCTV